MQCNIQEMDCSKMSPERKAFSSEDGKLVNLFLRCMWGGGVGGGGGFRVNIS
jgi:hypothetical protein